MRERPTLERVLELFDVNVETGEVRWRRSQGRAIAGALAGTKEANGYRGMCIDRKRILAHSLVYYVATGDWPDRIDHINGVRDDNRIANLRLCDAGSNARNRTNWRHKKLLGAHKRPYGRYSANITADGVIYHLGSFETEEQAHARYVECRKAISDAEYIARQTVLGQFKSSRPVGRPRKSA